jgi:hypothetical protein
MPVRPASHRTAERRYKQTGIQLAQAAARDADRLRAALRLCLTEIEQFHAHYYPKCDGGCPAHEAMDAARSALGD